MKLKITTFLVAWLYFALNFAHGQEVFTLSGKIIDASGKPLDGAGVYLLKGADSSLVKTAIADISGNFVFQNLKSGAYKLTVNMMGHQAYKSTVFNLDQNKIVDPISLQATGTSLKEVSVNSQRPFVQQKIDRTIINPEALISNAGGTALDVLEKSPGVLVDQNGAINLKGKSVTIFIDDKPTYLSGADLESYLRSLSSSAIDQIELMPNPPAKYDAAGNGGVINIRTKKNKVKGFNGGLNLSYQQGKYAKTTNSFNVNYRENRINLFANLSYNYANDFSDLDINRHFSDINGAATSNFLQNSYIRKRGNNLMAKIGADYYLTEKSTFGINLTGLYVPSSRITPVTSKFSNPQQQLDSTIIAQNDEQKLFKNGGINLNYRHQYDKNGHELAIDLDYLNYLTNSDQSFDNRSYFANGTFKGGDLLIGSLPANLNIYSVKADYDHPLKNGVKLSAGLKASYTHTDNVADYFYVQNGTSIPDYDKTNHFIYTENINAAYLNATRDYKKLSVQFGLRLENTISNGHQLGNVQKADSTFKRNYTSLFPTVYLQYKLDTLDKNQLSVNYGRRINRPYYQDLNPFLSPLDRFTFYTGNPFLRPSFTHNIELAHTFKNRFTTTLSYSRSIDDVNETIEIVDGIYYSRPGNIGRYTVKQLSFDASIDPAKWLNFHFYGHVANIHSISNFYTGILDTQGSYVFIRPIFTLKIGKDWTAQFDGSYQSKLTSGQFLLGARGRMNAAFSKKFSPSTTMRLVVNDIFYTFKNTGVINNLNQTTADWRNLNDSRTAVLSFSYRFGKAIAGQRKHDANGAESEQNRVKN